jgi:chaperonin cofactor prefoldin
MESRRELLTILVKTLRNQLARAETELAEVMSQLSALPRE